MNRVVTLAYQITGADANGYQKMAELSMASYMANLGGVFQPHTLSDNLLAFDHEEGMRRMFADMFVKLRELHKAGDNLLVVDPDTVCVKRTSVWERFSPMHMRMMWHTDPREQFGFSPYLNGGVIYIPAGCHFPEGKLLDPNTTNYDDNQRVFNAWFYSQRAALPLHPELNFCPNVPSPITQAEAHIIHFHSSRGVAPTLAKMQEAFAA